MTDGLTVRTPGERIPRPWAAAGLAVLVMLLAWAGIRHWLVLNPDGVSYLRIASYYAHGRLGLAVSGYWGPLISWIAVPALLATGSLLTAGRFVMAVSALVFVFGAVVMFRAMRLPRAAVTAGAVAVGVSAVVWSVRGVTPDLLLSGFLLLGFGLAIDPAWLDGRRRPILAGFVFGLAYLAKPVGLPASILLVTGVAACWWIAGAVPASRAARTLGLTLLAFGVLAAPWISIVSVKYGRPLFSTGGPIAHSMLGPGPGANVHPYRRTLSVPAPGRVTTWEDPDPALYHDWSPLAGRENVARQLRAVGVNVVGLAKVLLKFDLVRAGPFLLILSLCAWPPRRALARERWRWSFLPLAALAALYLPMQAHEPRYFFAVFPALFSASVGVLQRAAERWGAPARAPARTLVAAVLCGVSFAAPAARELPAALAGGPERDVRTAYDLARRLDARHVEGTLAGGAHEGLYAAFFAGRPWCGDLTLEPWDPGLVRRESARLAAWPADLLVAPRDASLAAELSLGGRFESLDSTLFASPAEAERCPLQVFRRAGGAAVGDQVR